MLLVVSIVFFLVVDRPERSVSRSYERCKLLHAMSHVMIDSLALIPVPPILWINTFFPPTRVELVDHWKNTVVSNYLFSHC